LAEPGYDAVLVVSFGGPEGPADIEAFLRRVTGGQHVPAQRLEAVKAAYELHGGLSPHNAALRELVSAVRQDLATHGLPLPVYWGNRNWHPLLEETVGEMARDGVGRAAAFVTSAFSSYPGCRRYIEDIEEARAAVGPSAPAIEKLRVFFDHPGFIEANIDAAGRALEELPGSLRPEALLVFSAHSLPVAMAARCDYVAQLTEASRLVTSGVGGEHPWSLAYQSRSGPPAEQWLEPDIGEHLCAMPAAGAAAAVIVPIGFVVDHMEVVHDLDVVAAARARAAGLRVARAATAGRSPKFVAMVRELLLERLEPGQAPVRRLGGLGGRLDPCAPGCCPPPDTRRRPTRR